MNLTVLGCLSAIFIAGFGFNSVSAAQWCERRNFATTITDGVDKTAEKTPSCSGSAANLVDGRRVNGSIERTRDDLLPPWIDLELARRGQKWAIEHIPFLAGSHIFGLSFVLAFPDNNAVLLFTNMSDTAEKASNRYKRTIAQVNTWYSNELKEGKDDNPLVDSILNVRALHKAAMRAGNERLHGEGQPLVNPELYSDVKLDEEMWDALSKDLQNSDIPEQGRTIPASYLGREGDYFSVSQWQQAMTQFAFVGFPVLFPERLMIMNAKDEDLRAFNHLWAVLGYMLGIDDKFNVALQPDLQSTKYYYKHIFEDWYIPQLFHLDRHTKILLEAQLQGFGLIREGLLTPRTLMMRMIRDIVKIRVPELTKILTPEDRRALVRLYAEGLRGYLEKLGEGGPPGPFGAVANIAKGVGDRVREGFQNGRGPGPFGNGGGPGPFGGDGGPFKKLADRVRAARENGPFSG